GERIFSDHIEGADLAAPAALENLDEICAGPSRRKRDIPRLSKTVASSLIVERGLTRKEFRCGAHVHGALFVRLFCKRIYPAAWLTQLACDPGEVNQFQDVLISVGLADDAFSAEDDGSGGFG